MTACLAIKKLSIGRRLTDVSLNIKAGSFTHVLGENGAGKSSLLAAMAGLLNPEQGAVKVNGKEITHLALTELAGFRGYHQQLNGVAFELTATEFIQFYAAPDHYHGQLPAILESALEVNRLLMRKLTELSGGELQRVNLCRALLQVWPALEQGTGLLLLDEPLQGLDIRHQFALTDLLVSLSRQGNTVVMTSHDLNLSANMADHIVLLREGRVVADGEPLTVIHPDSLRITFNCEFTVEKSGNSMHIQVSRPIAIR